MVKENQAKRARERSQKKLNVETTRSTSVYESSGQAGFQNSTFMRDRVYCPVTGGFLFTSHLSLYPPPPPPLHTAVSNNQDVG